MNDNISSLIKEVIPIIVGALIAIVPTMIGKHYDKRSKKEQKEQMEKQKMYTELISLFSKILSGEKNEFKDNDSKEELDTLRNMINMISITGSINVVKALNDYIDTWGKSRNIQTKAYTELLKTIRVDLNIDKKLNQNFPEIGLIDINIKNTK